MHCLRWALFGFIYLGCAAAVAWRNAAVGDPAARASVWLPFAGWYLKMQKGKNKEPDKDRRRSWPSSKAKSLSASLNTSRKASVLLCPLVPAAFLPGFKKKTNALHLPAVGAASTMATAPQ